MCLSRISEAVEGVKNGVDKTASELAIQRLKQEILELRKNKKLFLEETESTQKSIKMVLKIILVFGAIAMFGVIEGINGEGHPVIYLCVSVGLFFLSYLVYKSLMQISSQAEDRGENLEQQIASNETEIEHHKQIVRK